MATSTAEVAAANPDLASGHQENIFPPFDTHTFVPQLFWLIVIFGLLYWLMSRIALPRVEGILEARRHRLAKDLDDAAAMQIQAREAGEAYDRTLAEARTRAQTLAQDTHDKLHAEAEAKRHTVEADLNGKLAVMEAQIGEMRNRAMTNVGSIAIDAATSLVAHITGKAPNREAVETAVKAG